MTMRLLPALCAAVLGVLSALAVGCGGSGARLLAGTDASALKGSLAQVQDAVDARDCATASSELKQLRARVGALPGTVDRGLRQRLRQEINGKLAPQVLDECNDDKTVTQGTVTEPAPTGPTGPATTESTPPPVPSTTTTTPAQSTATTTTTTPPPTAAPDPNATPTTDANPGGAGTDPTATPPGAG